VGFKVRNKGIGHPKSIYLKFFGNNFEIKNFGKIWTHGSCSYSTSFNIRTNVYVTKLQPYQILAQTPSKLNLDDKRNVHLYLFFACSHFKSHSSAQGYLFWKYFEQLGIFFVFRKWKKSTKFFFSPRISIKVEVGQKKTRALGKPGADI
jgi:hypothetical protein